MLNDKRVLIISPHMDDETLGAGGSLLRFKQSKLHWLNITNTREEYEINGEKVKGYEKPLALKRKKQREEISKIFGFEKSFDLELRPTALSEYGENFLIGKIGEIINETKPNVLIVPAKNDVHSNHRFVYGCILPFTKSFRYPSIKVILEMEIISETEFSDKPFRPNFFVDISKTFDKKIEAIKIYEDELDEHPFPRSAENLKNLASFRGAMIGTKYAEAFRVLKYIA